MSDPTDKEIRLRCVEAASKSPIVHQQGVAVGVREVAQAWAEWVISGRPPTGNTLGVPKK